MNHVWPPRDPVVRMLEGIIDRSPHCDWLTSSESEREAERIISKLRDRGYEIVRSSAALPAKVTGGRKA